MSDPYDLPMVERLAVGTVGPPGQRVFYLQARQGDRLVTLKVEKGHVAELSRRLAELLADLPEPAEPVESPPLEAPLEADFAVGSMAIAYDEDSDRIVLLAEELVEEGASGAVARLGASHPQLAALARHGAELVAAGRPPCPLCGYPLDPRGHVCPRSNGHGPPTP